MLSAQDLRGALLESLDALRSSRGAIDAANVYPIPDADTGTNLVMTFEAVARALAATDGSEASIARAIADGALNGARGNSGVIIAQVLRAWADGVAAGPVDAAQLARIFERATELATASILAPAEGTILSVLAAARDAIAGGHPDVRAALEAGARAARRALDQTPEQLAVLARAGVVDAGGMGLVVVLDALARRMGADLEQYVPDVPAAHALACVRAEGPPTFRYEVQYLLQAAPASITPLRELLGTIGDSVAVIGADDKWRVHVHTDQPDRARALGEAIGELTDVELVDFLKQIEGDAPGARGIPVARSDGTASLIAVANGDGARRLFSSLGAHVIDAKAEIDEVLARIGKPAIVLPNDEEVFARAASALEDDPEILLLRTSDMAQGLAVALAYADGASFEANAREMREVFKRVRSAQVIVAPEAVETAIGLAEAGSAVAVVEGAVVAIDEDPVAAATEAARALLDGSSSVLTVLCGADVPDEERARLAEQLNGSFGRFQVELHAAGQPRHRYLLSSE